MTLAQYERIGIDPDRALDAANFLESYGKSCLAEFGFALELGLPAGGDSDLTTLLDAATSLREAATWQFAIDREAAARLIDLAAVAYEIAGFPYASYLAALRRLLPESRPDDEHRRLELIRDRWRTPRRSEDAERRPQQRAYAALAQVIRPDGPRTDAPILLDELTAGPLSRSTLPMGATGLPVRDFISAAAGLVPEEPFVFRYIDRPVGLTPVTRFIVRLATAAAERAALARLNSRLWAGAASPVEVVDLDVVALTAGAVSRFGEPDVHRLLERSVDGEDDLLDFQLSVAISNARSDDDPRGLFA